MSDSVILLLGSSFSDFHKIVVSGLKCNHSLSLAEPPPVSSFFQQLVCGKSFGTHCVGFLTELILMLAFCEHLADLAPELPMTCEFTGMSPPSQGKEHLCYNCISWDIEKASFSQINLEQHKARTPLPALGNDINEFPPVLMMFTVPTVPSVKSESKFHFLLSLSRRTISK
ncbi:hypothetical protein STEG23_017200, partial [Scotinomys teguina]